MKPVSMHYCGPMVSWAGVHWDGPSHTTGVEGEGGGSTDGVGAGGLGTPAARSCLSILAHT